MANLDDIFADARTKHRQGDLSAATVLYRSILTNRPDHAGAEAGLGVIALQTGKTDQALAHLSRAAGLDPRNALIQNNLGNAFLMTGKPADAAEAFDKAVESDPTLLDAVYNRAVAAQHLRRPAQAKLDYERVLAADPDRIDAAVNLAALHRLAEDPNAGIAVLERLGARIESAPDALLALSALFETVGRTEDAGRTLDRLPPSLRADPQAILTRARLALRDGAAEEGLRILKSLPLSAPDAAHRQAIALKALMLDKLGQVDAAYEAFLSANQALRATQSNVDAMAARYRMRIAQYRDAFAAPSSLPPPNSPLPFALVFFCGFPRSGTTLMEQILDAHPQTVTTGEDSPLQRLYETLPPPPEGRNDPTETIRDITSIERDRLRQVFVDIVMEARGEIRGCCLIDKLPLNLIELGIIARLFPEAKILTAIRDPRDCVLSAFMQPFRLNDAMACLTNLQDAAATYRSVFDLYASQKEVSGLAIQEYRYEDLIDDFDGTIRTVIDFLDLPWDGAIRNYRERLTGRYIATPSYMAVTQGLNRRAIGRWRRYAPYLEPVAETLAPYVKRFGYDQA